MRGVVLALLLGALGGGARAAEVGCVVKGTRALPLKVKADGEAFVFFRADEYRVRVEREPFVVEATEPLRFRGVLAMPLPSVRIARKLRIGPVWLAHADVKLLEARGRRALVDVNIDDVFLLRTELDCAELEVEAAEPVREFPTTNAHVKTRLVHLGAAPDDPSPLVLTVTDREHAALTIRRRQGRFALVEGYFAHGALVGWVPASELEPRVAERSHRAIVEPIADRRPPARATPEGSHPVRIVAGATVYAWPGRGAWATTARERHAWIADGAGEWAEVRSMGEHVWVRRASVVESVSSRRKQRRQTLARAVQP